jgi:hypothetical protein
MRRGPVLVLHQAVEDDLPAPVPFERAGPAFDIGFGRSPSRSHCHITVPPLGPAELATGFICRKLPQTITKRRIVLGE